MTNHDKNEKSGAGALVKGEIVAQQLSGVVDEKTLREFLISSGTAAKLTESQQNLFLLTAKAMNLNPLKREIYPIPFLKKGARNKPNPGPGDYDMSLVTGYEIYLKRAERVKDSEGKPVFDGYETRFEGRLKTEKKTVKYKDDDGKWEERQKEVLVSADPDDPFRCVVTIYRRDRKLPVTHTVYWEECTQNNEMWNSKPRTMLEKVALCQGFRRAFPDEYSGLPYAEEELPSDRGIIEAPPTEPQKLSEAAALSCPNPEKAKLAILCDEILHVCSEKKISDINLAKSIARSYGGRSLQELTEEELLEVKKTVQAFVPKNKKPAEPSSAEKAAGADTPKDADFDNGSTDQQQ